MDPSIIDILQELLAAEQSCLVSRLIESDVFVSPLSAEGDVEMRRIAREIEEHSAWLVELLGKLRVAPGPRINDAHSADLHFQELTRALPRVKRDMESIIRLYAVAAPRVVAAPEAAEVVARITERHRAHLEILTRLCGEAVEAAS